MGIKRGIKSGRPPGIGIGQGGARRACGAQMVEPGFVARQSRLDLAQARRSSQLPEQERQELALGGKPAHPAIGLVLVHKTLEHRPWNVLLKRVKHAIVVPHDIAPLRVSQTPRNV